MGDVSDRTGCKDAKPLVAGRDATLSSAEITCGREVIGRGAFHAGAPGGLAGAKPSRPMSGERL
jgi:hypothetical protein